MKSQNTLILLIACSVLACAQAAKSPPLTTGSLTGKVFLITQAGDLKQARFAKVYVLSNAQATAFKDTVIAVPPNPEQAAIEDHPQNEVEKVFTKYNCLQRRWTPVLKAIDGSTKGAETDEEGSFKLRLKPGSYTIVVSGTGGQNLAIWADDVTVKAGQTSSMKLHEPVVACLNFLNITP
jgi:uncharacterized protein YfaS (alpha-2-macroglobulin family)